MKMREPDNIATQQCEGISFCLLNSLLCALVELVICCQNSGFSFKTCSSRKVMPLQHHSLHKIQPLQMCCLFLSPRFTMENDLLLLTRSEHVIREQNVLAANEFIELLCEVVVAKLSIISKQRKCPQDFKEGISSLHFAAPICANIPELLAIRDIF